MLVRLRCSAVIKSPMSMRTLYVVRSTSTQVLSYDLVRVVYEHCQIRGGSTCMRRLSLLVLTLESQDPCHRPSPRPSLALSRQPLHRGNYHHSHVRLRVPSLGTPPAGKCDCARMLCRPPCSLVSSRAAAAPPRVLPRFIYTAVHSSTSSYKFD